MNTCMPSVILSLKIFEVPCLPIGTAQRDTHESGLERRATEAAAAAAAAKEKNQADLPKGASGANI